MTIFRTIILFPFKLISLLALVVYGLCFGLCALFGEEVEDMEEGLFPFKMKIDHL